MTNWKELGLPFQNFNEEITQTWIKNGFASYQVKEWLEASEFINYEDYSFISWLRDEKKVRPKEIKDYDYLSIFNLACQCPTAIIACSQCEKKFEVKDFYSINKEKLLILCSEGCQKMYDSPELQQNWENCGFTFEEVRTWIEIGLEFEDYGLAAYLRMKRVNPQEAKGKLEELREEREHFKGFSSWVLLIKRKGIEWFSDYERNCWSQENEKLKKEYKVYLEEVKNGSKLDTEVIWKLKKINPKYNPYSSQEFEFSQEQKLVIDELITNPKLKERYQKYGLCWECNQPNAGFGDCYNGIGWCQTCNAQHFREDFENWTSGNLEIDKFIQKSQLDTKHRSQILEWIPYDRLVVEPKSIGKGCFGEVYKAEWIDRAISHWNIEENKWERLEKRKFTNDQGVEITGMIATVSALSAWTVKDNKWERFGKREGWLDSTVALKILNNSEGITNGLLREIVFHASLNDNPLSRVARCFGISQDPLTKNYIMVMQYMNDGDLRKFVRRPNDNFYKNLLHTRLTQMEAIAAGLKEIHEQGLMHRDLHSGNILGEESENYDRADHVYITDLGLCKPVNEINQEEKIFGALPYVAPEVLQGHPYTQASDIYSFGIVAYELLTSLPPYYDRRVHDVNQLGVAICQGLRPQFNIKIPSLLADLINRCWDVNPDKRPTANEIERDLRTWQENNEFTKQLREFEEFNNNLPIEIKFPNFQIHGEAFYHSRLLPTKEITIFLKEKIKEELGLLEEKLSFIREKLNEKQKSLFNEFVNLRKEFIRNINNNKDVLNKIKQANKEMKIFFAESTIQEIVEYCDEIIKLENEIEVEQKDKELYLIEQNQ